LYRYECIVKKLQERLETNDNPSSKGECVLLPKQKYICSDSKDDLRSDFYNSNSSIYNLESIDDEELDELSDPGVQSLTRFSSDVNSKISKFTEEEDYLIEEISDKSLQVCLISLYWNTC
jgi:hypothetical protein